MHDRIDAVKCATHGGGVPHVTDLKLDVVGEILGTRDAVVDLRRQIVERAHAVPARE